MLKGPTTNLAFLTGVLGSEGDGERDFTEEGRRRAAENGVRKYRGESERTANSKACDVVCAGHQLMCPAPIATVDLSQQSSTNSGIYACTAVVRSQATERDE